MHKLDLLLVMLYRQLVVTTKSQMLCVYDVTHMKALTSQVSFLTHGTIPVLLQCHN